MPVWSNVPKVLAIRELIFDGMAAVRALGVTVPKGSGFGTCPESWLLWIGKRFTRG
jgi:hypothetical protein